MVEEIDLNSIPNFVGKFGNIFPIGKGVYGEVFNARCVSTGKIVAVKSQKTNCCIETQDAIMREIQIMKHLDKLKHPNFVKILDVYKTVECGKTTQIHLVMDKYLFDLKYFLDREFSDQSLPNIKSIMKQLLDGLSTLHEQRIFHRDLKPSNILLSQDGFVKISDFGLSGYFDDKKETHHNNNVITLWYRPPELLLGETIYGPEVDMWSAGCILAEMLLGVELFLANNEYDQLCMISYLCGELCPDIWPGITKLPLYKNYDMKIGPRDIKARLGLKIKDESAIDLISKLLIVDPNKRWDAKGTLYHRFFSMAPRPYDKVNVNFSQCHARPVHAPPPMPRMQEKTFMRKEGPRQVERKRHRDESDRTFEGYQRERSPKRRKFDPEHTKSYDHLPHGKRYKPKRYQNSRPRR